MAKAPTVLSDFDEVALQVGWAHDRWGGVEHELSNVYVYALKAQYLVAALDAFYAVQSFEGKLGVAHAAVSRILALESPLLTEWEDLRERMKSKNKFRNRIAHGRIMELLIDSPRGVFWMSYYKPHQLVDAMNAAENPLGARNAKQKGLGHLTAKQIQNEVAEFEVLGRDIGVFAEKLRVEVGYVS
jgi:hypothetical protein